MSGINTNPMQLPTQVEHSISVNLFNIFFNLHKHTQR